jgi:regulator of protease activity HflC (stomatin/prohibitin superfamily)
MISAPFWLLIFAVFLYLLACVKHVGKNERIVICKRGIPVSVKGPGRVLFFPLLQSFRLIDVSSHSLPIPEIELATTNMIAARGTYTFRIVNPLKAAAHANIKLAMEEAIESALVTVLSASSIKQCLCERFVLEQQILEMANGKAREWGAAISHLTLSDIPFPIHFLHQLGRTGDYLIMELAYLIPSMAVPTGKGS